MRHWFAAPVLFVAAFGVDGCAPKKIEAPPPPPPKLGPIEAPEDVVAEVLVRDPQALLDTVAQASGMKNLDPATLLSDPELAEFAQVADLHGTAAMAVLGDPRKSESWHFAAAVRLRDPKAARARFNEAVGKGKLKATQSPAIRSKIYQEGKSSMALIGEALVFADAAETIESAGRWIGKETDGTPPHEASLHVPLARWAGMLKGEAKRWVDAEVQKDPDSAGLEPLMRTFVDVVGNLGDVRLALDFEKEDAVLDFHLGATGAFSSWLGKYPAGTPRSILTLPRGSGAFVVRFPDAVSSVVQSLFEGEAKKPSAKKELDDVRILGRSIGHEVAVVYAEKSKPGEAPKATEAMVRIELVDPKGARAAIKSLIADWTGKPDRKITRSPWARAGADGESIQVVDGADKYDARWAIKGNHLFVDVAWDGKVTLVDAAVDPNAKSLLSNDPRAKSFADKLPKDGLVLAYYAQTSKAPKLEELGAIPALTGIRWGWASASKDGVASAWNVPLADLATYLTKGGDKKPEP
ncbi:MAG: hypothetical protein HYV09_40440 [Deltaproteobacteria bacterium]|nr:hypothetical protein [Deltaproteobacteria bacterium]